MPQAATTKAHVAEYTTIHGLPDLLNAGSKAQRILWAIIMLLAVIIIIDQSVRTFMEFTSNPVATRLEHTSINTLPVLIICPRVWVNETRLAEFGDPVQVYRYIISYRSSLSRAEEVLLDPDFPRGVGGNDALQKWYRNFSQQNKKIVQTIGRAIEERFTTIADVLLYIATDPDKAITTDSWGPSVRAIPNSLGTCYEVETNVSFSKLRFPYYTMAVEVHDSQMLEDTYYTHELFVGETGLSNLPVGAIDLIPNTEVMVLLTAIAYKRLSTRVLPCRGWSHREQSQCWFSCINKLVCKNQCKLLDVNDKGPMSGFCSYFKYSNNCVVNFRSNGFPPEHLDNCNNMCPRPCGLWQYTPTIVATKGLIRHRSNWSSGVGLRYLNFVDTYSIVSSSRYSFANLISNVGGTVSLCCGASMISFIQLITFICRSKGDERSKAVVARPAETSSQRL